MVKKLPASAGDVRDSGSIPGSRRSPGGGNGNPLQDSCLENSMHSGAWWVTVHGVTKSDCTCVYIQKINNKDLFYSTGNSTRYFAITCNSVIFFKETNLKRCVCVCRMPERLLINCAVIFSH